MFFELIDYIDKYRKDFVILDKHTHFIEINIKNNSYQKTVQKNLTRIIDGIIQGVPVKFSIDGESELLAIYDSSNKWYYIPIDSYEAEYSFIRLLCC